MPSKLTKISGIGIEIWTMQSGIMYDNFYVGHSFDDAKKFAEETFKVKQAIEKETEKAEKKKEEEAENKKEASSVVEDLINQANDFLTHFSKSPVDALKENPLISGIIIFAAFLPIILYSFFVKSGSSAKEAEYAKRKKEDISVPDVEDEDEKEDEADDETEDSNEKN